MILENEAVLRLFDPELMLLSLGTNTRNLHHTLKRLICTTMRQVGAKYTYRGNPDQFRTDIYQEAASSIDTLAQTLGFKIISFDMVNIYEGRNVYRERSQIYPSEDDNGGETYP